MQRFAGRSLVLAALLSCLVAAATGGALAGVGVADGAVEGAPGDAPAAVGGEAISGQSGLVFNEHDEPDNETERHRNPDEYGEDGDLNGLESWLAGRLSDRLGDSAIQLSEGQYDLAREFVGEEYRERFGQYVDVAGDTDGESAEEQFEETRDTQEELVNRLEEYEETREAYEAALEAGDEERARELARQLIEQAEQIGDVSEDLEVLYAEIEELTGADLSEAQAAIAETRAAVESEVAEIELAEFIETELRLDPDRETISFLDPLTATGQLSTVEGEPVANESITLAVGDGTVDVETDADGTFELLYRPTTIPLDTTSLSVEYVPDGSSVYLRSETSVPVTVEQVQPRFEDVRAPAELAYAESFSVAGDLLVDDIAVDGVAVELRLDGQEVGSATVGEGTVEVAGTVPASVPDGEQELELRLADGGADLALASVAATRTVTVRETETALSLDASQGDGADLVVSGALETVDGVGVGGEPVDLRVDGTTVATVTTAGDGGFAETVALPGSVEEGTVQVVATYEGADSNLAPVEAETVVAVEFADPDDGVGGPGGAGESGGGISESVSRISESGGLALLAGVVVGLLLVLGLALAWWLRRGDAEDRSFVDLPVVGSLIAAVAGSSSNAEDGAGAQQGGETGTGAATDDETERSTAGALLSHAGEQLQSGRPDIAVQAAYAAVRQKLAPRIDASDALTHWEFYRRYEDSTAGDGSGDGDDSGTASLREVTEEYERATFSGEAVASEGAGRVLEQARRLCGVGDEGESGGVGRASDD